MGNKVDMIGKRFGRFVAYEELPGSHSSERKLRCKCDCGKIVDVVASHLRSGQSRSCGCLSRELTSKRMSTHRATRTIEHSTWLRLRKRCLNPADKAYSRYGGRGIRVCSGWNSFENFLADMGPRPPEKTSIDRKDNDGHYSCGKCEECIANGWPANCRWADTSEQMTNVSSNVRLTKDGETLTLSEWSRKIGVSPSVLTKRMKSGWSTNDVLQPPLRPDRAGEKASRSKLTNADVIRLRELAATVSSAELGMMFGIRGDYALQIAKGLAWKHIGGPRLTKKAG